MKNELTEIELRKIIHQVLEEHIGIMYIPDIAPYILEKLGNAGFRCVGDNMIAIEKEEYDDLKHRPSTREWVETCRGRIEQARKETAREILQRIFNKDECGDLGEFCGTGWIYDIDEANAIFKEYGVEVEE